MGRGGQRSADARAAGATPVLRGYAHALAVLAAVLAGAHLLQVAHGDTALHVALLVYSASVVLLFAASALFHLGAWSARQRAALRRLDHAAICAVIAGGYTPLAVAALSGWGRLGLPLGVWLLSAGAMAIVTLHPSVSRPARIAVYSGLMLCALAASIGLLGRLGRGSVLLLGLSSGLCALGGLVYASRRPVLWPRVFGFHELFHLVVIAANAVFYLVILQQSGAGPPT